MSSPPPPAAAEETPPLRFTSLAPLLVTQVHKHTNATTSKRMSNTQSLEVLPACQLLSGPVTGTGSSLFPASRCLPGPSLTPGPLEKLKQLPQSDISSANGHLCSAMIMCIRCRPCGSQSPRNHNISDVSCFYWLRCYKFTSIYN